MAVHGVTRSTRDLDLLVLDVGCLEPGFWAALGGPAVDVAIRRGDADDPLAGVVRFEAAGAAPVDLIVGRSPWQAGVLERARVVAIEGTPVPVARVADLILLKLYAGGPQDAWDVIQLLEGPDRETLEREVEAELARLPAEARHLWDRVRGPGPGSRAPA